VEEQNEWMAGSDDHQLKNFIDRINTSSAFDQVHDPFGGVLTRQSGYLDTEIFMQAVTEFLRSKDAYQTLHFEATKMKIREDHIDYDDVACASVIFCDGLGNKANHFFGWVPVRPLKGETLTVSLPEQLEVVFNRGVYIVPTNVEQTYKVGATYNPRDVSGEITASARQEMEIKLSDLIKIPYRINHQNWGMRPTTPDRRPILGQHPEFKNLIIFTGLGTKGVSLAPYFSALLATWLAGQAEIPSEVNIARFKSLYSRFSSATV
jgi:glycine/D-amino acid oxidase-like deaminating enzyme